PEIERFDLAQVVLELRAAGIDPRELAWLEPPPGAAVEAAESLLGKIGALDGARVTPLGDELLRRPLHPRLARVLVASGELGVVPEAATLCAILGEQRSPAGGDVQHLIEMPLDDIARRTREQLLRAPAAPRGKNAGGLARAVLAGYPDRVARRRGDELLLADG